MCGFGKLFELMVVSFLGVGVGVDIGFGILMFGFVILGVFNDIIVVFLELCCVICVLVILGFGCGGLMCFFIGVVMVGFGFLILCSVVLSEFLGFCMIFW